MPVRDRQAACPTPPLGERGENGTHNQFSMQLDNPPRLRGAVNRLDHFHRAATFPAVDQRFAIALDGGNEVCQLAAVAFV